MVEFVSIDSARVVSSGSPTEVLDIQKRATFWAFCCLENVLRYLNAEGGGGIDEEVD
jgi:hypothetical protein